MIHEYTCNIKRLLYSYIVSSVSMSQAYHISDTCPMRYRTRQDCVYVNGLVLEVNTVL